MIHEISFEVKNREIQKSKKMNLIEAGSILSLFTTYHVSKDQLEKHKILSGPILSSISGALAGLVVGGISWKYKIRCFPETTLEYQLSVRQVPFTHILKSSLGFAAAFTMYEGLTLGIQKSVNSKTHDPIVNASQESHEWIVYLTHFFAGGISGLTYKAATFPFWKGFEEDPLKKYPFRILSRTFILMGLTMSMSFFIKESILKSNHLISSE